jgi:hypothetical protein
MPATKSLMRYLAALTIAPILLVQMVLTQETPEPSNILSSDLIAWSAMQRPQEPERNSDYQRAPNQTVQSPTAQDSSNPNQATSPTQDTGAAQAPTASTFTATVSKEGDDYVLKVSETATYKLDAKQRIEQYEGQRVRVTGTIESGVNLIHVDRIEPLS